MERKTKNIAVSLETYEKLCQIGRKNESFDDVVRRLIYFFEKRGEKAPKSEEDAENLVEELENMLYK